MLQSILKFFFTFSIFTIFEGDTNYKRYSGIIRINVSDWSCKKVQFNGIINSLDDNQFISKLAQDFLNSMKINFTGGSTLFVKYGMVYLANFQKIEDKIVQIFVFIETKLIHLQEVKIQNLPDNVQMYTEFSKLTFDVL